MKAIFLKLEIAKFFIWSFIFTYSLFFFDGSSYGNERSLLLQIVCFVTALPFSLVGFLNVFSELDRKAVEEGATSIVLAYFSLWAIGLICLLVLKILLKFFRRIFKW